MEKCEFRLLQPPVKGNISTISASPENPICKKMADGPEIIDSKCLLSNLSSRVCPIARYWKGQISVGEAYYGLDQLLVPISACEAISLEAAPVNV